MAADSDLAPAGATGATARPMVELVGIHKSFGQQEIVRGVDLSVDKGRVVCIIGPSGAGKTTLLRCINYLERPDSGAVMVDGELIGLVQRGPRLYEVSERSLAQQRASIGMVFQHFNLFPHMTVMSNVTEALIRVKRLPKREAQGRAEQALERVQMEMKARAYPRELSGGQQQRVAIARALAMDPKVMLFDEATSALDPDLVDSVLEVMRQLGESGMTMVVVTHELGFARDVADEIVVMEHGRVVDQGMPAEVISRRHTRTIV